MNKTQNYNQTKIGEIPEKWELMTFGELADITSSKRIFASEYLSDGVPFYRGKEIIEKNIGNFVSTELFISEEKYQEIKNKFGVPKENDILLTSVGTLGVPYRVTEDDKFYFKDGNVTWFRNLDNITSKFLFHWLNSDYGKRKLIEKSIGSTQQALTIVALKSIQIALPPIEERKQIASILSSLDDKIELNRKMNKTLEEIGKALFKRWFVDFEFPDENGKPYKSSGGEMVESELGMIPKGWNVSIIGQELETFLGGTPSRSEPKYWENGTIPWINSGKVNEFRILEASEYITEVALNNSAAKLLPQGSVVVAITGATLGQYSLLEINASFNQSVVGIKENTILKKEFIYFWIALTINELINSQTGGAQQHINKQIVDSHKILVPISNLLNRYYEVTTPLFDLISKNSFETKNITIIRDSLLPRLMSGKLRVKN